MLFKTNFFQETTKNSFKIINILIAPILKTSKPQPSQKLRTKASEKFHFSMILKLKIIPNHSTTL